MFRHSDKVTLDVCVVASYRMIACVFISWDLRNFGFTLKAALLYIFLLYIFYKVRTQAFRYGFSILIHNIFVTEIYDMFSQNANIFMKYNTNM